MANNIFIARTVAHKTPTPFIHPMMSNIYSFSSSLALYFGPENREFSLIIKHLRLNAFLNLMSIATEKSNLRNKTE